jgi:hypothetical protein
VNYLEDSLTLTTVSVGDTQITITNNAAGAFCPNGVSADCTPGNFSGYVFSYTGAPDITNVTAGGSADFQPVKLTFTADSITVNVAGDILAVGDQLILDVTTGTVSQTPLPATLPLFATGLGALGLLGWRRKRKA